MQSEITLSAFAIPRSAYIRILCERWFGNRWWAFALPIMLCVGYAFVDSRFAYLAVMLLFLVVPMVLSLVFFNHAFKKEVVYSTLQKTMTLTADGIELHFEEEFWRGGDVKLLYNEFSRAEVIGNHVIMTFANSEYTLFVIPISAFESSEQYAEFIGFISDKMKSPIIDN